MNTFEAATVDDTGSHSLRKGALTYASGLIGGANSVAALQRGGWQISATLEQYILAAATAAATATATAEGGGTDEVETTTVAATATATAEGGGSDEMETTTVAAVADGSTTTTTAPAIGASTTTTNPPTKKKKLATTNTTAYVHNYALKARWSASEEEKFRNEAKSNRWSDNLLMNLLDQVLCCCGCKLSPLAPHALGGYHFCMKTGLRLSASWCQEGYDNFNGDQGWTSTTHPCKRCASL